MNMSIRRPIVAPTVLHNRSRIFAQAPDIAALTAGIQGYHAEAKALAADVKATKDAVSGLETDIDRLSEKFAALTVGGPGGSVDATNLKAELKALGTFVRNDDASELRKIHAAMSVGSDPEGGYFVLPALSSTMTTKLFNSTVMRQLARVETITTGDRWVEPLDIDEPEAVWVGEKDARPKTTTPKLGKLEIPLPEIYALQPVTQRLLDDTGFDLGAWLEGKISDKFSRTEGQAFIAGNGVEKPRGLLSYQIVATADATRPWGQLQYVPSGDANGFPSTNPADVIRNLFWALRAPYRAGATWLLGSNTANMIDKFKDGQGNYLWRNSMTAGTPDTILNHPVAIDESMPDIAMNSTPIAFGNFKLAYVVVDKLGLRILRDPYTDKPNVLFYAFRRVGGGVANSEAVKLLKISNS